MNILEKSIRAIGGVFNERLLTYFKNYGATSNVLQDAEKEYLRGKGLTFGANQDAWKQLDSKYKDIIPLEVSDILKKYNATMLLPGVSGVLRFGYQPGNYRESTGQTLAAADQQVGLVVDATRVPGPELVTNGDFSNGTTGWLEALGSGASISGASGSLRLTAGGTGARAYQSFPTVAGRSYRLSITKSGGTATQSGYRITSDATGGATGQIAAETAISGNWSRSLVFTATASNTTIAPLTAQSTGTADFDNISVRELPGIHASQSTSGFQPVLRNTDGIQSWQFDGTDDRLSLSAVPFQMADDHFVVAGASRGATGISRRLFHVGGAGDVQRVAVLSFSSNGTPEVNYRNDAGTLATISGSAPLGTAPVVISATSISTAINLRAESILLATGTRPSGATTLTAAAVGAHTAGTAYFNGHIHGIIFGKGAITDSELLTLERFVASLQGRTL